MLSDLRLYLNINNIYTKETEQFQKYSFYNKEDNLKFKKRWQIALSFQWQ